MKFIALLFFAALFFSPAVFALEDVDPRLQVFHGEYLLAGIDKKTGKAYAGRVKIFFEESSSVTVIRKAMGMSLEGRGIIRKAVTGEPEEFAVVFHQGKKKYEAVYLFQPDYDNFFRFTGVFLNGNSSEARFFEALFPLY